MSLNVSLMKFLYQSLIRILFPVKIMFLFEINKPKLWSAEIPNLYTLYIEIYDGDNLLEVTSVKIGIRLFEKIHLI